MYFANPWGLLGLLALPTIVAIHLFQQRFPPLYVAGAHLWGAETRVTEAGRRRDRLPITATLLLELLAALLLTLALSEPRFGGLGEVAHIVAVLDDSASMQSRSGQQTSPRDQAVEDLERRVEAAGRSTVVTLILTGPQPTLLGRRSMPVDEMRAALAEWSPGATRHDFQPAWDEAMQLVGETGRFVFLTDDIPGDVDALPGQMEVAAFGRPQQNVAISAARWTFDSASGTGQIFLRIANYGSDPADVTVTGAQGEQRIFQKALSINSGDEVPLETEVPGGLRQLTITATSRTDGLAADNTVTLVEPQARSVTIAVTLPEDSIELGRTERVLRALPDVQLGPIESADLQITSATHLPGENPERWWLGIGPINPTPAIRKQAVDLIGPYLIEKQNPLMSGIVLDGVVWGGVQAVDLPLSPLVSSGRLPLLGRLSDTQTVAYLMNIDFARSNLGDSPDWPIFIANLVTARRDALPGLRRWNYRLNEIVRLRLDPAQTDATEELLLVSPDGSTRTLVRDRNQLVEISRFTLPGVYEIREGETVHGTFAANFFDPDESDIASLSSGEFVPPRQFEATKLQLDNPYSWLMILAILLMLVTLLTDWFVLRPRRGRAVGEPLSRPTM